MRIVIAVAAILLFAVQHPFAQDQFERQVRTQLDKVGQNLAKQGFELTTQIYTGELDNERNEEVTVRLRAGVRYAIVGVCDEDCDDLDIVLYNSGGREVASDVQEDDVPVVEITPDRQATFSARAVMASCKKDPCSYGLGLFASSVDPFERQVREQLSGAAQRLTKEGYVLTHQIHTGDLQQNQEENVVIELDRGRTYVILGVCDADCKDLDLRLLNSSLQEIDRDVEKDDYPAVSAAPARTERYTVRAIMAVCSTTPCRYGFGVFSR